MSSDLITLVRWAIAESKPWLCGPSAADIWNAKEHAAGLSCFADWCSIHIRSSAEYEKRIAALEEDKTTLLRAGEQLQAEVERLKAANDKAEAICADIRKLLDIGEGESCIGNVKNMILRYQELQAKVKRLEQLDPLPPGKCIANKLNQSKLLVIAAENILTIHPEWTSVADHVRSGRHEVSTIAGLLVDTLDVWYPAIYGEQTAEAKGEVK
jgi:uncharacterized small protein (DUF1192 family)